MSKKIPISAAKEISKKYNKSHVIIVTFKEGTTTVTTYGDTIKNCKEAAIGGNFVKKALGFPENLCNTMPSRIKK